MPVKQLNVVTWTAEAWRRARPLSRDAGRQVTGPAAGGLQVVLIAEIWTAGTRDQYQLSAAVAGGKGMSLSSSCA